MSDSSPRLLIDTSVLIQAHRTYYAFHLCPGFWNCLVWFHGKGKVLSLDEVKNEIIDGKEEDAIKNWVNSTDCFMPCKEADVIHWYGEMQKWVQAQPQFFNGAKAAFANDPDAWILAYAKAKNLTLVHHEDYQQNIKRAVKMPNVCRAREFQIPEMDVFEMLQHLGVKFDWGG